MDKSKMKNFEFFTLEVAERFYDKKAGILYLLINHNRMKIRNKKDGKFYTNIVNIELVVNAESLEITNNHLFIMFADFNGSDVIVFESTDDFVNLCDFKTSLESEKEKGLKFRQESTHTLVSKVEMKSLMSELENINRTNLIDKALKDKDEDLFNKLTESY